MWSPSPAKSIPSGTRPGRVVEPDRSGGVEKTLVSFGYMFESNCPIRLLTCASVISVLWGTSLRQSPAGNAVPVDTSSLPDATQTSTFSPTPRRVYGLR